MFFSRYKVKLKLIFGLIILLSTVEAFGQNSENPAMPGFNQSGSDAKAIKIADEVMNAMGGRKNWNNTRHVTWNFFGIRTHIWDKWSGDYRLEADSLLVLMNLNTQKGRAWINGKEVADLPKLAEILKNANSIWINDSYWMFMPYKLKDSGVTLKYKGEGTLETGQPCDILQLTFENVGDTPQNKYLIYVSKAHHLVEQWSYFTNASDAEPRFTTPWNNWRRYGKILLSDDRGKRKHSHIAVFDHLPAKIYQSPEAIDVMQYNIGAQN